MRLAPRPLLCLVAASALACQDKPTPITPTELPRAQVQPAKVTSPDATLPDAGGVRLQDAVVGDVAPQSDAIRADAAQDGGGPADGELRPELVQELVLKVPSEWRRTPVASNMRLLQLALPGPAGDGELVVFRFPGGAGGVEANLERWRTQLTGADGLPPKAERSSVVVGALKVTLFSAVGDYATTMQQGMPAGAPKRDHRLWAAIVEGSGDPFYLKVVGPRVTIDRWYPALETMARTLSAGLPPGHP